MSDTSPLLVTNALPYANGPIHLGHLVETIQSDIFARFHRLIGREVLYVCAADTHGTPIEVNARRQGLDPSEMVERYRREHARDFADFEISFDTYFSTNADENRQWAERVYGKLREAGLVTERPVEQFYCETDARFLPDRFVKGTCPNCGALDQYGDVCEVCNKTYTPVDLREPYCVLCRNTPVRRESDQIFVRLEPLADFLRGFSERLQPEVRNYVSSWLEDGLKDWCISRDGPYFGFRIPDTDKFFYVWLDAPVGYISAAEQAAIAAGKPLHHWWPGTTGGDGSTPAEIVHFIGKDIIYFHTLFWPAMLKAANYAQPTRIQVHGMLHFGGAKMSKSRGRMISGRDWLNTLDPAYLRYYLAANLGPGLDDIEFSTEELRNRVNSHLVNNVGNLVNRALAFTARSFEGRLASAEELASAPGYTDAKQRVASAAERIRAAFADANYRDAIRQVESLASFANEYMQSAQPWKTAKTDPARARADLTLIANVVRALATFLSPVVPRLSEEIFSQLGVTARGWEAGLAFDLVDHDIGTPKPLLPPLDVEVLEKLMAPPAEPAASKPPEASTEQAEASVEPIAEEIVFDDFAKVDLRVGVVVEAKKVPKADKLLELSVDVGEGEPRTIAAGIALAYEPEELVGRRVVVVANLAPRKLRGITSRGMLLAASGGPKGLILADIPGESAPGTRVK